MKLTSTQKIAMLFITVAIITLIIQQFIIALISAAIAITAIVINSKEIIDSKEKNKTKENE